MYAMHWRSKMLHATMWIAAMQIRGLDAFLLNPSIGAGGSGRGSACWFGVATKPRALPSIGSATLRSRASAQETRDTTTCIVSTRHAGERGFMGRESGRQGMRGNCGTGVSTRNVDLTLDELLLTANARCGRRHCFWHDGRCLTSASHMGQGRIR